MFNYPPSIKASIVAVSEEPDLNGKPVAVYNIKVVKDFEGSTMPMTWNVVRSLKDFQENHIILKVKYGLLKKFEFKNKKIVNMIRRKSSVDVDDQHVAQYLEELVVLNPIPDEVISLLALENVRYAEKQQLRQQRRSRSSEHKKDIEALLAVDTSATQPETQSSESLLKSDSFSDFQKISKSEDEADIPFDPDGVWKDVPDSPEALKDLSDATSFKSLAVADPPPSASVASTTLPAPSAAVAKATPESTLRQRPKKEIRAPKVIKNFFNGTSSTKKSAVFDGPSLSPEELQRRSQQAVYFTSWIILLFGFCSVVLWVCRLLLAVVYPSAFFGSVTTVTTIYCTRLTSLLRFFFQLGILCLYAAYLHRLLGAAASFLLQSLLGTHTDPGRGKFNIDFKYVALRLGLDTNQIVIGNIVWHNTSAFKHTPCLLSIEEVIVTVDIASLYYLFLAPHLPFGSAEGVPGAVHGSLPIVIREVLINNVNIYVEKTANAKDGLNLFAALGAVNNAEEQSLQQYILSNMANVAVSSKKVADMVIKYNPASLLLQAATGSSGKKNKKPENHDDEGGDESSSSSSSSESESGVDSGDESCVSDAESSQKRVTKQAPKKTNNISNASNAAKPRPPLLLLIHKLIVFELLVHAQDFLNASHVSTVDAKPIHLVLLTMTDSDLNKRNKRFNSDRPRSVFNYPRSGVAPNDIVWRLLNALSKALLRTNKMAIMQIVSGAALNQTTTAVFTAATGLASGVVGGASLGTSVVKSGAQGVVNAASAGGSAVVNVAAVGGSAVVAGGSAVVNVAGSVVSGVVGTAASGVSGVGSLLFGSGEKK